MTRLPEKFQEAAFAAGGISIAAIGIGFQLSGFTNKALAIVLYVIGGGFFLFAGILTTPLRKLRIAFISDKEAEGEIAQLPVSEEGRTARITTVSGRRELFESACSFLRSKSFSELIVYAPTGVWEIAKDDPKWKWFRTIATCLVNAQSVPKSRIDYSDIDSSAKSCLGSFRAVFGLPPHPTILVIEEQGDTAAEEVSPEQLRKEWSEFFSHLDKIQAALGVFNGIPTAHLRYLETDVRTIPGTGCVIFDDEAVAQAVTVGGRYQVDYIYTVEDKEIGDRLKSWFHTWEFPIAEANVLQDIDRKGITLEDGFRSVRAKYKKQEARQFHLLTQNTARLSQNQQAAHFDMANDPTQHEPSV